MRLLLDTHAWIWFAKGESARFRRNVLRGLRAAENERWLSPVSVWETLVLVEKGRLELPAPDAQDAIEILLQAIPTVEAPLTHEVARESRRLTMHHEDPADRFIVATARVYGLTLVTMDERIIASKAVAVL